MDHISSQLPPGLSASMVGTSISQAQLLAERPGSIQSASKQATDLPEDMSELGSEFESVFLSLLLKELRQTLDEGFFGSESSDSFGGMFDMYIGKHLSENSPLGIGDMIETQYASTHAANRYQEQQTGDLSDGDNPEGEPLGKVSVKA
ncbi:MAG: rod-binding protein [Planctomycetota bacterium]